MWILHTFYSIETGHTCERSAVSVGDVLQTLRMSISLWKTEIHNVYDIPLIASANDEISLNLSKLEPSLAIWIMEANADRLNISVDEMPGMKRVNSLKHLIR